MQLGTKLILDDFEFPILPRNSLDFDMNRAIAKIDIPGAPSIYQDMGMDEKTLDFSGTFTGDNALDISAKLEAKWWTGQELQLTCGDIKKRVRFQKYSPKIIRSDRVDYSLHLIVCFPEEELSSLNTSSSTSASTTSSAAKPTLSKTMDRSYTIKSGDTLWAIAARNDVYGDGTKWEIIAKANNISDPRSLQIGQVIKIPSSSNIGASISAYNDAQSRTYGSTGISELQTIAGRAS